MANGQQIGAELGPPYVEKLDTRGALAIWVVDGSYVRTHIDAEFTNFGQHYRFSFVPENELWLDRERVPGEYGFFIEHLLVEHAQMSRGKPYAEALEMANRVERKMRRRAGDIRQLTRSGTVTADPTQVHVRLWRQLENGLSVWIVSGRLVRSVFDIDFTAGGHDCVYEFVPLNEVWIDDDIEDKERGFVLLHELHERNRMAGGWPYSRAHEESSRLEYDTRRAPDLLHDRLVAEGWV